jgi:hypothetical protein
MLLVVCLLTVSSGAESWSTPRSAELCGECHRTTFAGWEQSRHARAFDSRLFRDTLWWTQNDFGAEARQSCLNCHAPLVQVGDDPNLQLKVTWEGVTCDYCHSIREVSMTSSNAVATFKFNLMKSGPPWMQPDPRQHGFISLEIFTNSEFCALCHQYQNPLGYQPITTFSEWQASRYAKEGRQCQSCHMSSLEHVDISQHVAKNLMDNERHDHCDRCHAAHTSEPPLSNKIANSNAPRQDRISWHGLEGNSAIQRLTNAISAQLTATRIGDRLRIDVEIANTNAGHYLPTGSPMRQLILEVRADTATDQHFSAERFYRRVMVDAQGKPLDREYVAFIQGVKTIEDTRLAPDEKRTETFQFNIPQGTAAQIKATLWLFYSPLGKTDTQQRIAVLSLEKRAP